MSLRRERVHLAIVTLLLVTVAGLAVAFSPGHSYAGREATAPSVEVRQPTSPATVAMSPGVPVRILIPTLDIDAPVDAVGVVGDDMALPDRIRRVGWLTSTRKAGARRGATLIAGHRDDSDENHGALWGLERLVPGDNVTVETAGGLVRYRVASVETVAKDSLPNRIVAQGGRHALYLVTCGGDIVGGHWDSNVIVTAIPERSAP